MGILREYPVIPLLLLLFIQSNVHTAASAQQAQPKNCRVGILRVPSANNQLYALLCRCGPPNNPGFRGRVVQRLPPSVLDTAARAQNTVRCLREQLGHLRRRCTHSSAAFVQSGRHALQRCVVQSRPRADNGKPFSFKKNQCAPEFRTVAARGEKDGRRRLESFIVCSCRQASDYSVQAGVVNLVASSGAGPAAVREAGKVLQCASAKIRQLGGTCGGGNSQHFELRAAQRLNVCCKRLRVRMPFAKLQCQRVVPDDVSSIQIQL